MIGNSNRLKAILFACIFIVLNTAQAAHPNNYFAHKISQLQHAAPNINPKVLRLALIAYTNAHHQGMDQKGILTIVDYSLPDNEKRLWVFDLKRNRLLFNTWVAHGKNSGYRFADSFSNAIGSEKSSIGLYLTGISYYGSHGYSLRLKGLDKGYNNNAYERKIVMHGAWYVSAYYATHSDHIGRSWGCFALPRSIVESVIDTVKDGTLLFAYAPNYYWEITSRYLRMT